MFSTLKHTDSIWKVRKLKGKKRKSLTPRVRVKVSRRESREALWHDAVNEYHQHPLPL